MIEPMNGPQLHEIYRLEKENNKMLRSLKRQAFWGGLFKLAMYLFFLGLPIWLYFSYLAPVIKHMDDTLSAATGKKIQLEGQLADWAQKFESFKSMFTPSTTTSSSH
jgi:hypothetical protein